MGQRFSLPTLKESGAIFSFLLRHPALVAGQGAPAAIQRRRRMASSGVRGSPFSGISGFCPFGATVRENIRELAVDALCRIDDAAAA